MATRQAEREAREQRKLFESHTGIVCAIATDVRRGAYDELIARTVASAALRSLKMELEDTILRELPKYRRQAPVDAD